MELLQLKYFYESAKTENISKTAEKFLVPTTSVSASIKRLETELGCKLFDRTSNRIHLNANGQLLQTALCSAFRDIDRVVETLSTHDDVRPIRILARGMRRKITNYIIEYSQLHDNATFKTTLNNDENYREYDVIIDDEKHFYDGYERMELFSVRLGLKCSPNNKFYRQKITLDRLCDQPFVLMDTDSNMHRILGEACKRAGFSPYISVVCNDIECYEKFIAADMGIGIAQKEQPDSKDLGLLRDLNVTDFKEHYTLYAYYSKKEYYDRVKDFVEYLRRKCT